MMKGREISDQRFQVDALDGLRGIAVLLVIFSHTSNAGQRLASWLDFSGIGKSGVFLFFMLSAFLLTYPFIASEAKSLSRFKLANYFVRRFCRIYPLYFLYLLAAVISTALIAWWLEPDKPFGIPLSMDWVGMWRHLTLQEGKGVTWSIAVEFQFYFVLPIVVAVWVLAFNKRLGPCALVIGVAIAGCYLLWPPAETVGNDVRLGPYLSVFLLGSLLALCHYHWRRTEWCQSFIAQWLLEGAAVIAVMLAVATIPAFYNWLFGQAVPRNYFHHAFIPYALIWGGLLFGVLNGRGYLRRILEWHPLRVMGFISFSAYLIHPTCVGVFAQINRLWSLPGWLQVSGVLALTVAISMLSFRLIEAPSARIRLQQKAA
ncbi:acyltransferase [Corallincola luteus]|uniref:Acyltransferase n=1 Tax=Corallincola luteus TaxID=1775177 RepID=A0ABY2ANH7_9GAMM|nr:acyltransferase [Corallincola luteus]TCI04449.1 acyltransferase [Corallincola luteus]